MSFFVKEHASLLLNTCGLPEAWLGDRMGEDEQLLPSALLLDLLAEKTEGSRLERKPGFAFFFFESCLHGEDNSLAPAPSLLKPLSHLLEREIKHPG